MNRVGSTQLDKGMKDGQKEAAQNLGAKLRAKVGNGNCAHVCLPWLAPAQDQVKGLKGIQPRFVQRLSAFAASSTKRKDRRATPPHGIAGIKPQRLHACACPQASMQRQGLLALQSEDEFGNHPAANLEAAFDQKKHVASQLVASLGTAEDRRCCWGAPPVFHEVRRLLASAIRQARPQLEDPGQTTPSEMHSVCSLDGVNRLGPAHNRAPGTLQLPLVHAQWHIANLTGHAAFLGGAVGIARDEGVALCKASIADLASPCGPSLRLGLAWAPRVLPIDFVSACYVRMAGRQYFWLSP